MTLYYTTSLKSVLSTCHRKTLCDDEEYFLSKYSVEDNKIIDMYKIGDVNDKIVYVILS